MRAVWGRAAEDARRWDSLSDWARDRASVLLDPIARVLSKLGLPPNLLTFLGFLLQAGIGLLFYRGYLTWGGLALLIVAPLDALDGAVARAGGLESRFGAFLDSTLDRFSDAALILGLAGYHLQQGMHSAGVLFLAGLVAALMVSYTRARAEGLGISCKVGLLSRMERIFLIATLSLLGLLTALAWILSVLSAFTVLQRIFHVHSVSGLSVGGK